MNEGLAALLRCLEAQKNNDVTFYETLAMGACDGHHSPICQSYVEDDKRPNLVICSGSIHSLVLQLKEDTYPYEQNTIEFSRPMEFIQERLAHRLYEIYPRLVVDHD
jgi:hypothetical protein